MYRLLTRQTYEYEMFERASRKLAIETVVLNHEKMLKNATAEASETPTEANETPTEANETLTEANETPAVDHETVNETATADNETPITNSETPAGENAETRALPEESSIAECQLNDTLTEDQESVSTKQGSGNQLEDLPDGEWVLSEEKKESDEEYVMEEEEDSVLTKNTEEPSIATEKSERILDYGIPAVPVIPEKKRRGRKPTKKRTIEDELNPLKRSKNEVEEMLRRGLFDCLMSNSNENGIDFFEADIDTILKKNLKPVGEVRCCEG